jgi:hypothetical protein
MRFSLASHWDGRSADLRIGAAPCDLHRPTDQMTTYTVSYDLIKRKDYPTLWAELARLGAHRTQASYWLVSVNKTAAELHDHLKSFVDEDDRVWVSELTKNHHYSNAMPGTTNWIKSNPPAR